MRLLIATKNHWKYQLFAPIFAEYGFDVVMLSNALAAQPPPCETGRTVVENALLKARHYHAAENPWVFGDDTGLEIDALNNEPGVQARRWAGHFPDDVEDQVWLDYLLHRMQPIPVGARTAYFVDGWALVDPDGRAYTREIRAAFEIAPQPVRPMPPGAPIMAVAVGIPENPADVFAAAKARWTEWGVLEKLTN